LLNYLHDRNIDPQQPEALEQIDLPDSLYSLILSRIDQLTENQKTLLKVASVIGRLFRAAMLWGVYNQFGDHSV
jgi:predicted ATPase